MSIFSVLHILSLLKTFVVTLHRLLERKSGIKPVFPLSTMSLNSVSARLKIPKYIELAKSQSQAQVLASRLRNDGVMTAVECVMQMVDQATAMLSSNINNNSIPISENIFGLCQHLKVYGCFLDVLYKDQLNHAFNIFRDRAQEDGKLDELSRVYLLELIELRAKGWNGSDAMGQYYRKRVNQITQNEVAEPTNSTTTDSVDSATPSTSTVLAPGEVLKSSGKFAKPARIPGKKYCKDEVVIRNADSGKVNTGAKERLVQITGATEESINHAKQLIEDTIRRNASPVREPGMTAAGALTCSSSSINSSASDDSALPPTARASRALTHSLSVNDAYTVEYKHTVVVGGHTIKLTGDNLELVRMSKIVLDEYFSGEPINDIAQFCTFDSLPQSGASTNDLTVSPPPPAVPSTSAAGDQTESQESEEKEAILTMRRPRLSTEQLKMYGKIPAVRYSIEYLAKMALSPMCVQPPKNWEKIAVDYSCLVRPRIEFFNANQYLRDRQRIKNAIGDKPNAGLTADDFIRKD